MKNNLLIAQFMGWKFTNTKKYWIEYPYDDNSIYNYIGKIHKTDSLTFNSSWDWLMPCIQKILNLDEVTENMEEYYSIIDNIPDINATYKAIIRFIEWYNQNKTK
jgi:hypothetical protein